MCKPFYLTLLVILVVTWFGCTVESQGWLDEIQPRIECKCKVASNRRLVCSRNAMPRSQKQKMDALKCLCKKHRYERKMDAHLRKTCKEIFQDVSIPLTLA